MKKEPNVVFGSADVKDVYEGETGDYRTAKGHKADTKKGEWPFGETSSRETSSKKVTEGRLCLAA